MFPRIERVVPADQPVLLREGSGFDSDSLLWAKATERDRLQALGRSFDFICTWNPRQQDKAAWIARAEAAGALVEVRPGKRTALLSLYVERAMGKHKRPFRLILHHKVQTTGFSRSASATTIGLRMKEVLWTIDTAATRFTRLSITLFG